MVPALSYSYSGMWRDANNFTLHCVKRLPIDGGLRLESQNGSTFHTIGSVAPHTAIVVIAVCDAMLCL
jgi:hypothetical protein